MFINQSGRFLLLETFLEKEQSYKYPDIAHYNLKARLPSGTSPGGSIIDVWD